MGDMKDDQIRMLNANLNKRFRELLAFQNIKAKAEILLDAPLRGVLSVEFPELFDARHELAIAVDEYDKEMKK